MAATAGLERTPRVDRPTGDLQDRVIAALLRCICRWGLGRITVDDVAREAGVSRATLYRAFPGGRDVVFETVLRHELARLLADMTDSLEAADDLEDLVVTAHLDAARFLREHEALNAVLAREPELLMRALARHRLDPVLSVASAFLTPLLERFTSPARAAEGTEVAVRLFLSFCLTPSSVVDLTDAASVRRYVRTFVLPGLRPAPTPESRS